MNVKLVAQIGEHQGREVAVVGPEWIIGRDPACQLQIIEREPDLDVSGPSLGMHATAEAAPPSRTDEVLKRVRLLVRTGKSRGRYIEVSPPRFLIGRDPSCQIRAHSQWVSRIHASVEQCGGKVFVFDHGSTNGTKLNERRLQGEEVEVTDGDLLEIGPLQFTVVIPPESADRVSKPGSVAPYLVPPVPLNGLQLTCAIQPGSVVSLFSASEVRADPAPLRTATLHHSIQEAGIRLHTGLQGSRPRSEASASLEQLFHEFLLSLGHGGSAPTRPVPPLQDVPRSVASASCSGAPPARIVAFSPSSAPPSGVAALQAKPDAQTKLPPETDSDELMLWPSDVQPADGGPEFLSETECQIQSGATRLAATFACS